MIKSVSHAAFDSHVQGRIEGSQRQTHLLFTVFTRNYCRTRGTLYRVDGSLVAIERDGAYFIEEQV